MLIVSGFAVGVIGRIIYVYLTYRYSRPQQLPVKEPFIAHIDSTLIEPIQCEKCNKPMPEWSFVCPECFTEEKKRQ